MRAELLISDELISELVSRLIKELRPLFHDAESQDDRYMTMKELSEYLGVAYSTIANNKKYLPHYYFNGTPLFKKSEIDRYLSQFKREPAKKPKNRHFEEVFNGKR